MLRKWNFLLVVALALCAGIPASASVIWNLSGVAFADGGIATGFFTWDASTDTMGAYSISVSGGDIDTFPAVAYDNGDSSATWMLLIGDSNNTFIFEMNGSVRELRFTPITDLTNAGGTVPLNLSTANGGSGGVECFNCGPFRLIDAGSLTSATPEPATLGMSILALGILVALSRGRSKV